MSNQIISSEELEENVKRLRRFGADVAVEDSVTGGIRYRLRGDNNSYVIDARPPRLPSFRGDNDSGYLGAQASAISGGGRDLADGSHTSDTWTDILADIIAFEFSRG